MGRTNYFIGQSSVSSAKRILTIRVSGRERKEKVRKLLYDLAHFRNMLIILIRKYRLTYKENLLCQSILYGFLSSREYSGKYTQEFDKAMRNIEKDKDLCRLLEALKAQSAIGNKTSRKRFFKLLQSS